MEDLRQALSRLPAGALVIDLGGADFLPVAALGALVVLAHSRAPTDVAVRRASLRSTGVSCGSSIPTGSSDWCPSTRSPPTRRGAHDPDRLDTSLDRLREARRDDTDLTVTLRRVVDALRELFDADGAGLMLVDDGQLLHYVATTDGRAAALEAAQSEGGEGPCVDSLVHARVVHSGDLAVEERWPRFRADVVGLGVRSICGVPIHAGGSAVGSLNLYSDEPRQWAPPDLQAIAAYGAVVEEAIGAALLAHDQSVVVLQLQHALESRVVIERAVGILMARNGIDAVGAFALLRSRARGERRKVAALAEELVADPGFRPVR